MEKASNFFKQVNESKDARKAFVALSISIFTRQKISPFTFSYRRFPLSFSQTEDFYFHFLIQKISTFTFLNKRFPLSLSQVNEAKDVGKAFVALSTCMQGLKLELGEFKQIWMKYSEIWTVDRVQFIDEMEVERI